jgi:hypothetical protein
MLKINEEKLKVLSKKLKKHWGKTRCPMCQIGKWIIQDSCFELREFHDGKLSMGGSVIPVILVTVIFGIILIYIQ